MRRWRRRLLSKAVIIPVVFVGAVVLGILIYYWTVFSVASTTYSPVKCSRERRASTQL